MLVEQHYRMRMVQTKIITETKKKNGITWFIFPIFIILQKLTYSLRMLTWTAQQSCCLLWTDCFWHHAGSHGAFCPVSTQTSTQFNTKHSYFHKIIMTKVNAFNIFLSNVLFLLEILDAGIHRDDFFKTNYSPKCCSSSQKQQNKTTRFGFPSNLLLELGPGGSTSI